MNAVFQLSTIVAISAAAAGGSFLLKSPQEKGVIQCEVSLLKKDEICLKDVPEEVLWIDARSRKEWEQDGVSGSVLWNMDPSEDAMLMEAEAAMAIMNAAFVVIYCKSEDCGTSRQIADLAIGLDLGPPVRILHGGWEALNHSSLVK